MVNLKTIILLSKLLVALLFMSCNQHNDNKSSLPVNNDTVLTQFEINELKRLQIRDDIERKERRDSLILEGILEDAIDSSKKHLKERIFDIQYQETHEDSFSVNIKLKFDYLFTENNPHLLIKRETPENIYIDVFTENNGSFEKVLSHIEWTMTYVRDTIWDINGDGLNDFVLDWYGSNGCCLKAFSNVYLLESDLKSFADNIEFVNPTFSPKEKLLRGVGYGHPRETELYKYKWKGNRLDTLEYVYYERNKDGELTDWIIVANSPPFSKNNKVIKRLKVVPTEYRKIFGYEWFIDDLEGKVIQRE